MFVSVSVCKNSLRMGCLGAQFKTFAVSKGCRALRVIGNLLRPTGRGEVVHVLS